MLFNLKKRKQAPDVKNHENAPAFSMTPQLELYSAVDLDAGRQVLRKRRRAPRTHPRADQQV